MQHQSCRRKNNRTPDLGIPAENMEQPDHPSLHYGAAARIQECKNQRTRTIPLLEELCLKRIFSILVENYKLTRDGLKQLPLPPMMISKIKRIFSAAESLVYAPNLAHEYGPRIRLQMTGKHALGDCKLQ